jgi:hypothetical protein
VVRSSVEPGSAQPNLVREFLGARGSSKLANQEVVLE